MASEGRELTAGLDVVCSDAVVHETVCTMLICIQRVVQSIPKDNKDSRRTRQWERIFGSLFKRLHRRCGSVLALVHNVAALNETFAGMNASGRG